MPPQVTSDTCRMANDSLEATMKSQKCEGSRHLRSNSEECSAEIAAAHHVLRVQVFVLACSLLVAQQK